MGLHLQKYIITIQFVQIAIVIRLRFVIINFFIGYYRVNYDDATWAAIDKVLYDSHTDIHVLNRAQVINTYFYIDFVSLLVTNYNFFSIDR